MSAHPMFRPAVHAFAALLGCCLAAGPAIAADPPAKAAKPAATPAARKPPPAAVEAPILEATSEQKKAAEMVDYGTDDCEFNQSVQVDRSQKYPHYVEVKHGKSTWLMKPVLSSTGAVRLEDVRDETLMLQIANKSMLLNTKTGHRIVDDCLSVKQHEVVDRAKAAKASEGAAPK